LQWLIKQTPLKPKAPLGGLLGFKGEFRNCLTAIPPQLSYGYMWRTDNSVVYLDIIKKSIR
tara:strand:- start:255 stop:437 length:183 start_codon:yes stop_codon:yes gene_type:complete